MAPRTPRLLTLALVGLLVPGARARADDGPGGAAQGDYDRCFGVPSPAARPPIGVYGEVPLVPPSEGPGRLAVPKGHGDDKAWLVVLVVAVAVLPVVLYAIDDEAPPLVQQRFDCPTFRVELAGGAQRSHVALGDQAFGQLSGRFEVGYSYLATDLEFDTAPGAVRGFGTHLLVRASPHAHVEGALSVGLRRNVFGDQVQGGLELGLPHRYVFWRGEGLRALALELRPSLLFTPPQVEPGLSGALLIPLVDVLQLRLGGRLFTFNGDLFWSLQGGIALTL